MSPETIMAAQCRRPFVPFRLHVGSEAVYEVIRSDAILVCSKTTVVHFNLPTGAESFAMLSNNQITSLEFSDGTDGNECDPPLIV